MAIAIQPYTEAFIPAVKALNRRLACGGIASDFHFPESPVLDWLPKLNGRRIYQECFLAVDSEAVRGGFIVKQQEFSIRGEMQPISFYRLPVSEGIVDRNYMSVGVHMLRNALRAHPRMFALGMGGFNRPLPQMLKAMGWTLTPVPFFFYVNHPARFLRNIAPLRQDPIRRMLADAAAGTGLGWVGINTLHWARTRSRMAGLSAEPVLQFDSWADDLWQRSHSRYMMIGSRDRATLNLLYKNNAKYLRLKISKGSETLGWAVVLDTQMQHNKYFGDLRVGSIADCLAASEDAPAVIQSTTEYLRQRGVDLIVTNQSHAAWCGALRSAGFLEAPTNFVFASSKELSDLLAPLPQNLSHLHLNRGDGDGPVNL